MTSSHSGQGSGAKGRVSARLFPPNLPARLNRVMNFPMTPGNEPPLMDRVLGWIPFVVSAALVATAVHLALRQPVLGLVLGELALVLLIPQFLHRRRLRRVLRSGDVNAVLSAWES